MLNTNDLHQYMIVTRNKQLQEHSEALPCSVTCMQILPSQLAMHHRSDASKAALAFCVGAKGDLHSVCATTQTLAPSPSPRGPSLMFTDRPPKWIVEDCTHHTATIDCNTDSMLHLFAGYATD